jgi:uncharacterized protein YbjQ (UPF0145 family)
VLLTTLPSVEGRSITEYLDLVTTQAIMGVKITKDIRSIGANIVGGRVSGYEEEVATAVADVKRELAEAAEQLGADAVVGVDLDFESMGGNNSILLVAACGTAVKLG